MILKGVVTTYRHRFRKVCKYKVLNVEVKKEGRILTRST